MGIFRSEKMLFKRLRMPKSIAHNVMNELGNLEDAVEFVDLTKDDQEAKKNFIQLIKRCDEIKKKIRDFDKICNDYNEPTIKYETFEDFLSDLNKDIKQKTSKASNYFDVLENEVIEDEKKVHELLEAKDHVAELLEDLIEKKAIFEKCLQLLDSPQMSGNGEMISLSMTEAQYSGIEFIAGTIKADDELRMKRMIFRVSKGRALPSFFDMPYDKFDVASIQKKIFTVVYQGSTENYLKIKLNKITELFNARVEFIPRKEEIKNILDKLKQDIYENSDILRQTRSSIKSFIKDKIDPGDLKASVYELYRLYFRKEKYINNNLNKCYFHHNFIDGEVWIPESSLESVKACLEKVSKTSKSEEKAYFISATHADLKTPTYVRTNDFTWAFQEIVNLYGAPRYQEVNPALFNIVTFPFLFGVMFGDIGHGFLLLLLGGYLCLFKDDIIKSNSPFKMALKGRYILLMMGFFAFYCGWLYNDFLSMPTSLFNSCYVNQDTIAVRTDPNCVYPIGIDPKWYSASNELAFFNSLKMKISVILGVTHMIFGIFLRGINNIHFNSYLDFIVEFVPQIIFMSIVFGYMIIMIFIKWAVNWNDLGTNNAPGIITLLMNIFLNKGKVGDTPLWGAPGEQESFHFNILIVALICIPILLLPKPLIINYINNNKQNSQSQYVPLKEENQGEILDISKSSSKNDHQHQAHAEPLGELFIHQGIETIEFVLGSISSTASYLRLWALSLAHAQLSKVFFEKCILGALQQGNIFMLIFGFFIFANFTVAVLMMMDLLECFLHTLRLHWVEFQNKFYKADGVKFAPFSFKEKCHARLSGSY